jgi:hypothetical protein
MVKQSDSSPGQLSGGEKNANPSVLGVGSRLATGPAPELVQTAFARELADQLALFRGMSLADLTHTVTLIETGVIPREAGAALLGALLDLHEQPADFVPVPEESVGKVESPHGCQTHISGHLPATRRIRSQSPLMGALSHQLFCSRRRISAVCPFPTVRRRCSKRSGYRSIKAESFFFP